MNEPIDTEQKLAESQLATARARVEEIECLYERIYEDNVNGKVSDEWFMKLFHKYKVTLESRQGGAVNFCPLRQNKIKRAENCSKQSNIGKKYRVFLTSVMNTRYCLSDAT